jgi:hypothetical protein
MARSAARRRGRQLTSEHRWETGPLALDAAVVGPDARELRPEYEWWFRGFGCMNPVADADRFPVRNAARIRAARNGR